ncbi:MAG: PucR family transcriptional regulator ligand-binding domain-containing protein [Lacisediminihabitans sp.]
MLLESSLHLTLLCEGDLIDTPIQWAHASDLVDPTPFLENGQMLLTVGTQFGVGSTQSDYDAYVHRLVAREIVALGFGTEVVRAGTPPELIVACTANRLTLVEVPYETPFIAMARWVVDVTAHEAREREDATLAAQRAISLAAIGHRGLPGVLAALAHQLGTRVLIYGRDGVLDTDLSPSELDVDSAALQAEVLRLLRSSNRSASSIAVGDELASLQTFGPRGRLSGVLVIVGLKLDTAAQRVITTAVALIEISLEQGRMRRGSLMPLHEELLSLLIAGHTDIALRAVPHLPRNGLRLFLCRMEGVSPWFINSVERRVSTSESPLFLAPHDGNLVILVAEEDWKALALFLAEQEAPVGVSDLTTLSRLGPALVQARHALAEAATVGPRVVEFSSVRDSVFLGIVSSPQMIDLATALLNPLLADDRGRALLADTVVWLEHNGVWDSAATELGIHRHSLKKRVETVVSMLGLSVDKFGDRAQLWWLLRALNFEPRGLLGHSALLD